MSNKECVACYYEYKYELKNCAMCIDWSNTAFNSKGFRPVGDLVAELRWKLEQAEAEVKELREALERAKQGYENLIELKILPHAGWDVETEKLIAEMEEALRGAGK